MPRQFLLCWVIVTCLCPAALAGNGSPGDEVVTSVPPTENGAIPTSSPLITGAPPPAPGLRGWGIVGAIVGVAVPLTVAAIGGAASISAPRAGDDATTNEILGIPIVSLVAIGILPLTTGLGTFLGLAAELGVANSVAPAIVAGVIAPVGMVVCWYPAASVGGLIGIAIGTSLAVVAGGDFGGLGLIASGFVAGMVIGGTLGATAGVFAAPIAVAAGATAVAHPLTGRDEPE